MKDLFKNQKMKMQYVYILNLVFLYLFSSISFACELPLEGITFSASQIEKGKFRVDLTKPYTMKDISKIESVLKACKSEIASSVYNYREQWSSLLKDEGTLKGYQNIKDLIARINTLQKEKKEIKKTLSQDLSQIIFRGIYGVIIQAPVNVAKDKLLSMAKEAIAIKAIEDLRGVAINSVTVLKNGKLVFDRIVAKTAGEMDIEDTLYEERKFFRGKTQLFYIAVVKVFPLKRKIKTQTRGGEGIEFKVANLLCERELSIFGEDIATLTTASYASKKMKEIKNLISSWKDNIKRQNSRALKKEQSLLNDLEEKLNEKDNEIEEVKKKIEKKRNEISKIYQRVGFSCAHLPEECLNTAISHIHTQIDSIKRKIYFEKEKEFEYDKARIKGTGEPAKEIVELTKDLYKNLKATHCQRQQLLRFDEVEAGKLVKSEEKQGYYITRIPKTVHLYPYYTDEGDLELLIVMSFRVNPSEEIFSKKIYTANVSSPTKLKEKKKIKQIAKLFVEVQPSHAQVRILNIRPKYYPGIELKPGRYLLEIYAEGYECIEKWVDLKAGDNYVSVYLKKKSSISKAEQDLYASKNKKSLKAGKIPVSLIAGQIWKDPYLGMEFVYVPGGCFEMGCGSWDGACFNQEKPVHEVCVDGFWIGKYEVTVGQFKKFLKETGYKGKGENYWGCRGIANPEFFSQEDNHPVVCVSWYDAKAFAEWLSKKTGYKFRLPTEAEWEYACRSGGGKVKYGTNTGDISYDLANYRGVSRRDEWRYTSPVGSFPPNPIGLYDMSGNVFEWCEDWYDENYYKKSPRNNPKGPSSGWSRVCRDGSWFDYPRGFRCAGRFGFKPMYWFDKSGFRLVRLP